MLKTSCLWAADAAADSYAVCTLSQAMLTSDSHNGLGSPEPLEHFAILPAPDLPGSEQEVLLRCNLQGIPHKP